MTKEIVAKAQERMAHSIKVWPVNLEIFVQVVPMLVC